jgi:hypothetical protein
MKISVKNAITLAKNATCVVVSTLAMNGFIVDIQIDSYAQIGKANQCSRHVTSSRSYQPQFSGKAHRIDRVASPEENRLK